MFSNAKWRMKRKKYKEPIINMDELRKFLFENFYFEPEATKRKYFLPISYFCLLVKQSKADFSNLWTDTTYKVSTQNIPITYSCCIYRC